MQLSRARAKGLQPRWPEPWPQGQDAAPAGSCAAARQGVEQSLPTGGDEPPPTLYHLADGSSRPRGSGPAWERMRPVPNRSLTEAVRQRAAGQARWGDSLLCPLTLERSPFPVRLVHLLPPLARAGGEVAELDPGPFDVETLALALRRSPRGPVLGQVLPAVVLRPDLAAQAYNLDALPAAAHPASLAYPTDLLGPWWPAAEAAALGLCDPAADLAPWRPLTAFRLAAVCVVVGAVAGLSLGLAGGGRTRRADPAGGLMRWLAVGLAVGVVGAAAVLAGDFIARRGIYPRRLAR